LLANNNGLSPNKSGLLANKNGLLASNNGLEKKKTNHCEGGEKKKKKKSCLSGVRTQVPCPNFFKRNTILTHSITPPSDYRFKEGYAHHEDRTCTQPHEGTTTC
jgi:hypothetical protein